MFSLAIVFPRSRRNDNATRLDIFKALALTGTAKIIEALSKGPMRYSEIVKIVGFSTNATRSLKALQSLKLVKRRVLSGPYRPVEYSLTDSGVKVRQLMKSIEAEVAEET